MSAISSDESRIPEGFEVEDAAGVVHPAGLTFHCEREIHDVTEMGLAGPLTTYRRFEPGATIVRIDGKVVPTPVILRPVADACEVCGGKGWIERSYIEHGSDAPCHECNGG